MREDDAEILAEVETIVSVRLRGFFIRYIIAFFLLAAPSAWAVYEAFGASDEIQEQRFDSLVMSCEQQNERHDRSIARLAKLKFASRSEEVTTLLINEIVPYVQDCEASAKSRVKGEP